MDQTDEDVVVVVIGHYAKVKVEQIQGWGEAVLYATIIVIVVCVLARRQYAVERKHMFNNDQFVKLIYDLLFIFKVYCYVFIFIKTTIIILFAMHKTIFFLQLNVIHLSMYN